MHSCTHQTDSKSGTHELEKGHLKCPSHLLAASAENRVRLTSSDLQIDTSMDHLVIIIAPNDFATASYIYPNLEKDYIDSRFPLIRAYMMCKPNKPAKYSNQCSIQAMTKPKQIQPFCLPVDSLQKSLFIIQLN